MLRRLNTPAYVLATSNILLLYLAFTSRINLYYLPKLHPKAYQ